ncbi:hypothetical protein TNCV_1625831 [Trichonephila clavipes]|nr:hypothetical protein TNCV_1625831 [Trichonephila clavipes]
MIRGGIVFAHMMHLVHIDNCLTANRYVKQVVKTVVLLLMQGAPNTAIHQDNGRPNVARWTLDRLSGLDILL